MKRRVCALMLILLTLTIWSAYAAGPYCVDTEYVVALVNMDGTECIPNGIYENIFCLKSGSLYAAGKSGEYHLFNEKGVQLTEDTFAMARLVGEIIIFRRDGMYGAMDVSGNVLIEPVWRQLIANGDGGFLALDSSPLDDQADEIIYIDNEGKAVFTGNYILSGLRDISDDRMPFMTSDGHYGYLDERGTVVIPASWLYAGDFLEGIACVTGDNGKGMIDTNGNVIIEPIYTYLERGENLVVALSETGEATVFEMEGRSKFNITGEQLQVSVVQNCVVAVDAVETRVYGADGTCLLTASAGAVVSAGLNGQLVIFDGEWGEKCQWLINADGSAASEKYQRILPLAGDRYAYLTMSGTDYYSADLGTLQKSWDYDSLRYGLMDGQGQILLPAEYLEICALDEDRFLLIEAGAVYFADENGQVMRTWTTAEGESASSEAGA